MRSTRILTVILAMTILASSAAAQTPDAACAADTLYLISPDQVNLDLQETGRVGMVISWPNLDLEQATCYSLAGDDTLAFTPAVTGGFGDRVDRVLGFSTVHEGQIGANQEDPLQFTWRSIGANTYGTLAGILNLANNGGILRWSQATGGWVQMNTGLPQSWRQTNVVALGSSNDGILYAGFTSGQLTSTEPRGLYRFNGTAWSQVGADVLNSSRRVTRVAVDPTNSDHVAVGTALSGLFVSTDGGQTFTNWTAGLDPGYTPQPASYEVTALNWRGGRLMVAVRGLGLFSSGDGGATWSRLPLMVRQNLDVAASPYLLPIVNDLTVDPANGNRVLAALSYHGVFQSQDGGASWDSLYGNLIVPDSTTTGAWINDAISVAIDPGDPQTLVMAVRIKGLYRTADGGQTWNRVAAELQPENTGLLRRISVMSLPGQPGRFLAAEDLHKSSLSQGDIAAGRGENLLESTDGGATWHVYAEQPVLDTVLDLEPWPGGGGDFLLTTWAGGIYEPGTALPLADTYTTGTSPELRNLDLGLQITFDAGQVAAGDAFELVCQTFQGWAVWRAPAADLNDMTMIGLYDRVNPETCIEGYCGDLNFDPIPSCFKAKRAACFDLANPDTIRFFDSEIYNGFGYYYAVSSFDYGNTAGLTPENNNKAMVISPRWQDDALSPFHGDGNRTYVQVNLSAEPAAGGQEIYVYPNPLRLGEGLDYPDDPTVVWTNLPPASRIRIFTTAGDDVVDLGPEIQVGGQIRWLTRNRDDQPVSAGVYLYKVEMPEREPYWGRLVIIR